MSQHPKVVSNEHSEAVNRVTIALMGIEAHYKSLGKFIAQFSQTEVHLQLVLWQLSGMKLPTAKAVLSGVKLDNAIQKIKRIMQAEKWEEKAKNDMLDVLDKLKEINDLRDEIIHYGLEFVEIDKWKLANKEIVFNPETLKLKEITVPVLEGMSHDLQKIRYHLAHLVWHDQITENQARKYQEILGSAWLHKYGKPARRKKPPHSKRKAPSSQH